MLLLRRYQQRLAASRALASTLGTPRVATYFPRGRCHCACEALERRQLMAATPVALAIESGFGIEAGRAFPATGDVGPSALETYDLAVLPSGKALVAGGNYLVRLDADGTHDRAFADNGYARAPDFADSRWAWWNALLPTADGRILVGGTLIDPADASRRTPLLARYTADGAADATFGAGVPTGLVLLPFATAPLSDADGASVLDLDPLPGGAFLAAGFVRYEGRGTDPQDLALWKIRADGTPDPAFGDGGLRVHDLADGAEAALSVVVRDAGGFFAATTGGVVSFDASGAVAGFVDDPAPAVIAPGPFGTLVTARATETGDVRVRRFLPDGTPDTAFGGPTGALVDFDGQAGAPTSVVVVPNGRTLVAAPDHGTAMSAFDVVALTPAGVTEDAFGTHGRITELGTFNVPARLAPGPGGRLVVGAGDSVMGIFARSFVLDPGITLDDGGPYPAIEEGGRLPVSAAAAYAGAAIDRYEWDAGSLTYNGTLFTAEATGAATTVPIPDNRLPHLVTLRVTTSDGLAVVRELPVEVRNAPPVLGGVIVPSPVPLGADFAVTGSVSDPGGDAVSVSVDYGDGTPPVVTTVDPTGRFTVVRSYAARGMFRVSITAADDEGAATSAHRDIVVADVVGNIFRDTEDDGRRAPGDEPVVGATVYVDSDADGAFDEGEPRAQTNANGEYYFLALGNGTHSVRLDTPAGFRATTPPGQGGPVVIDDDGPGARRDFGLTDRARISGIVFDDANASGARDVGEASLQGVAPSVYLDFNNDGWRDAGEPVATQPLGSGYVFANIVPGTYTVRLNPVPSTGGAPLKERAQTFPFDRGGQTGHVVTVSAGELAQGLDFGSFFGNTPITGVVYEDRNRNGSREAGEFLLDRAVYLDFDNDGVLDADESRFRTISPQGPFISYLLPVIRGRTYTVRTVLPEGWTQSEPGAGAPYVVTVDQQNTAALQGLDFGMHRTAPGAVVGRHLFFYKSVFGGTEIFHPENDASIARDKAALLPGGRAAFANVSTYSRGINGLMIDLDDLNRSVTPSGAGSFLRFDVGGGMPGVPPWTPLQFGSGQTLVRRGAGVNGSDRVVVYFADGAIRNQWLRVTVLPGPASGLAAPDVFYFGHLDGDAGGDTSPLRVGASDLAVVRRAMGRLVAITDPADFNRDGRVDARDFAAARQNVARTLLAPTIAATASHAALTSPTRGMVQRRGAWDELA